MTNDTPKRKRGRPKLDRPPKLAHRPFAIKSGATVRAIMPPETVAKLDKLAADSLLTRSAMLRRLIDDEHDRRK